MSAVWDREEMIRKAENLVRTAAEKGAQVVLLQELFETPCSPKRPGPWP